jgi:hypothetical protein
MKLRVTPLSGLYSRIFNIALISQRPMENLAGCGGVRSVREDHTLIGRMEKLNHAIGSVWFQSCHRASTFG